MVVSAEAVGSEVKGSGAVDSGEKDSAGDAASVVKDFEAVASVVKDSEAASVEKVVNPESILDVLSEGSWDKRFVDYFLKSKYKMFFFICLKSSF